MKGRLAPALAASVLTAAVLMLAVLAVFAGQPAAAGTAKAGARPEPQIVEVISPGGIRAWLRQETSIPLLALEFRFEGGSTLVPAERAGAAALAAAMLTEGAGDRDAEAFRQVLADHSISLDFDAGREGLFGSVLTLTEHRDLSAGLVRDALLAPRLEEGALNRVRSAMLTSARRRSQDPNSLAYQAWRERAYGDHPYAIGTQGTEESLPGLGRADVEAFLQQALNKRTLIVGAAGDIGPAELGLLLDRMFGDLPDREPPPPVPPLPPIPAGVEVVPHPAAQSVIVFGHAGISRPDPDWPAAMVVAQVLGGSSFTSRLGSEVREKRGLAYGIGVSLNAEKNGGILAGRTATRNEAAAETMRIIREEWAKLAAEGPTAEEVEDAKAYLIGSFPLSLDSTGSIASVLVSMQYYGLGRDYWETRAAQFEAVTLDDARRVAAELLAPDALLSAVAGQPEGVTSSF